MLSTKGCLGKKKKNEELNEIKNLNFIISEDTLWRNVFTQCVFEVQVEECISFYVF